MVRVHHCFRFVSQKVFSPSSEPTSAFAATPSGLVFVATERRRVQVFRLLEDGVKPIGGFPSVAVVQRLLVCEKLDYVAALEEKSFQTFVRVYFRWREFLDASSDSAALPSSAIRMKLALDVVDASLAGSSLLQSPPASPPSQNEGPQLEVVEVSLKDYASAIAVCPETGDLGVAVNRAVMLYQVVAHSRSEKRNPNLALKFVLNLDQVASDVALSDPFVGVVYATSELKVFRVDSLRSDDDRKEQNKKPFPRISRSRHPVVKSYQISFDGDFVKSHDERKKSSSVVFLRRPLADYASPDAPTTSIRDVVLLPAVAQERRYEGTQNFDMVDLETLDSRPNDGDDILAIAGGHVLLHKPTLVLYKNFELEHRSKGPETPLKLLLYRRPDSDATFCLTSGFKQGFLYALPSILNEDFDGARSRLMATYPFTSPPFGLLSDGTLLHALTDNGLETYPCRSYSKVLLDEARRSIDDEEDAFEVDGAFPPEEVATLGLTSFIGARSVARCRNHVILLIKSASGSSSDPSWAFYALETPSMASLHEELVTLADRYREVSRTVHGNLLLETLFMMRSRRAYGEDRHETTLIDAVKRTALRCFDFYATQFPDRKGSESFLGAIVGDGFDVASLSEMIFSCRRVAEFVVETERGALHRTVVKIGTAAVRLKVGLSLKDEDVGFLVESHLSLGETEKLARLIVAEVLSMNSIRLRRHAMEMLKEAARDRENPCAGVVAIWDPTRDVDVDAIVDAFTTDFILKTARKNPECKL